MLQRLPTTFPGPVEIASQITGRTIAHSHTWSDAKRVKLAAKACFGAVIVTPLTAIQAAEVFSVPLHLVAAELKRLGHSRPRANGHTNGNGNGHAMPNWDALTSEQRSKYLEVNFDAIWSELEVRTGSN